MQCLGELDTEVNKLKEHVTNRLFGYDSIDAFPQNTFVRSTTLIGYNKDNTKVRGEWPHPNIVKDAILRKPLESQRIAHI